jgi:hypothetical protein
MSAHRDPTYGLAKKSAWFLLVGGVEVHLQLVQWKAAEPQRVDGAGLSGRKRRSTGSIRQEISSMQWSGMRYRAQGSSSQGIPGTP